MYRCVNILYIDCFICFVFVGGNRVILLDVSFNPCTDSQAVRRCYRYGQNKCVGIYRFVCNNTLESIILKRQIFKESMSSHIVDQIPMIKILSTMDLYYLFQQSSQIFQQNNFIDLSIENTDSTQISNSINTYNDPILIHLFSFSTSNLLPWLDSISNYDTLLSPDYEYEMNHNQCNDAWKCFNQDKNIDTYKFEKRT
jgi:hypothetical protein